MINENSLQNNQKAVDIWVLEYDGYWSPLSISVINEELGEVSRDLEKYKPRRPNAQGSNIGEELADLLFSVMCIANHYQINLSIEFNKILEKYNKRDSNRFF